MPARMRTVDHLLQRKCDGAGEGDLLELGYGYDAAHKADRADGDGEERRGGADPVVRPAQVELGDRHERYRPAPEAVEGGDHLGHRGHRHFLGRDGAQESHPGAHRYRCPGRS